MCISLIAFSAGCESEVQIMDPLSDQPVVYCLLNQDTEDQYLRLSRAYLSNTGQAPPDHGDSLVYFSEVEAQLEEINEDEVVGIYPFHKIEIKKDSGLFPLAPHWIYKASVRIIPDNDYRLVVHILETDKILYSECKTLSRFSILDPIHPEVRAIHILPDHNPVFRWTAAANAIIYQLGFLMHYTDIYSDSIVDRTLQIPIRTSYQQETQSGLFSLPINSNQFYKIISELLDPLPGVQRAFKSLDVLVQAGGEDLAYYIQQLENEDPFRIYEFNNFLNSQGVFSAIAVERINNFQITKQSIDSLAYGRYTNSLNFLDRYGNRKDQ